MSLKIEIGAEPVAGYRLSALLGRGDCSQVWKAARPDGTFKAVKIIQATLDPEYARQELHAFARVQAMAHPALLRLERFEIVDGQLILITELADSDLMNRLQDCRQQGLPGIPRAELLDYLRQAAALLDLLFEQQQLPHLDIKPQNLLLVGGQVKVGDYGLARDLDGLLTSPTGGVTPAYAAPERFRGAASPSCDQYSLAICFHELLTGQRPFSGSTAWQLSRQHQHEKPDLSLLPAADRGPIGRALAKIPEQRFRTCTEMVRCLIEERAVSVPAPTGDESSAAMSSPAAIPEINGDGILFPALVVGLGTSGLRVLQELGNELANRFGAATALPCIRLLGIDTDKEEARTQAGLPAADIFLAPLNRSAHYYRLKQTRPRPLAWIETRLIHRLPRTQETNGTRLFGRLAFFDHYRSLGTRLASELSQCAAPDALQRAATGTQLGLSSNRPRVFIVTSLHGGTGSGLFLDLAYLLRKLLFQAGYSEAEISGLFLLPDADTTEQQHLANCVAALIELNHFSSPQVLYGARFDDHEGTVKDAGAPFSRCVLLPLAGRMAAPDEAAQPFRLAGQLLVNALTTALGKSARAEPADVKGMVFQTIGLHEVVWPRSFFLEQIAGDLCRRVVAQWLQLTPARREAAQAWVEDNWTQLDLDPDRCLDRLRQQCDQSEGKDVHALFDDLCAACLHSKKSLFGTRKTVNPAALELVLRELDARLGRQGATSLASKPGTYARIIDEAAAGYYEPWRRALAERIPQALEASGLRFAGVEEVLRLLSDRLQRTLQQHRNQYRELVEKSEHAYDQIRLVLAGVRQGVPPDELEQLVRRYPRLRLKSLLLKGVDQQLARLSEFLGNMHAAGLGQCRQRLAEIAKELQTEHAQQAAPVNAIYPGGYRKLADAVDHFGAKFEAADAAALEQAIEKRLAVQGMSLRQALISSGFFSVLKATMRDETRYHLEKRIRPGNVIDLHLEVAGGDAQISRDLAEFIERAAPRLRRERSLNASEKCVVALPGGAGSTRYQALVRALCPQAVFTVLERADRIAIHREDTQLPLEVLGYLGSKALKAYRSVQGSDAITPHSRCDMTDWLPLVSTSLAAQ